MKTLIGVCAIAAFAAGCSTTSPDVIKREDAQHLSNVLDGVVISTRAVVQAPGSDVLKPGDAVIIITEGGRARVIKAPRG